MWLREFHEEIQYLLILRCKGRFYRCSIVFWFYVKLHVKCWLKIFIFNFCTSNIPSKFCTNNRLGSNLKLFSYSVPLLYHGTRETETIGSWCYARKILLIKIPEKTCSSYPASAQVLHGVLIRCFSSCDTLSGWIVLWQSLLLYYLYSQKYCFCMCVYFSPSLFLILLKEFFCHPCPHILDRYKY